MKLIREIPGFFPSYALAPLLLVLAVNFAVYLGIRAVNRKRRHYSMWLPVDDRIPFVPFFVVFYVLAYVQWAAGYILMARQGEAFCFQWYFADIVAKLITGAVYLAVPTGIERPEICGKGFFSRLTGLIFKADAPDNLFPSIHCLESWLCCRAVLSMAGVPSALKAGNFLMTVLVFASTVCLKQHVFVDIPAGIAAAEAGIFLVRLIIR